MADWLWGRVVSEGGLARDGKAFMCWGGQRGGQGWVTGAIWRGRRVDRRPQETLDGSGWEIEKTTVSGVNAPEVKA